MRKDGGSVQPSSFTTAALSRQAGTASPAWPENGHNPASGNDDRQQLDLFIDGRDAILIHEVVTALLQRDGGGAAAGMRRLEEEHPRHPDLPVLTTLVHAFARPTPISATHSTLSERIDEMERRLAPAARRFLGVRAADLLRPMWQALAATASGLPFTQEHPRAHRGWLGQQSGEWAEVLIAVEREPDWADTPLLRYWAGLAQQHLGASDVAIRLWLPLCWQAPELFTRCAPTLPNPMLRGAWVTFEESPLHEASSGGPALGPSWFPPWVLVRHPGLARLFRAVDVPDAGDATRVFRHLLALLPLEQRGVTDELVLARRALRQLNENFFRDYMAVRSDRRRSAP